MTSLLVAVQDTPESARWVQALRGQAQWLVQGPVHSLADTRELMRHYRPDLLVADLWLRDGPLGEALRPLHLGSGLPTAMSGCHVLTLSPGATHPLLLDALQSGADSYFDTSTGTTQELIALASETLAGGARIAPWIARQMLDHFDPRERRSRRAHFEDLVNPLGLTLAERDLLRHLAVGENLQDLARAEGVRPRDLAARVRLIYRKMQWSERAGQLALS